MRVGNEVRLRRLSLTLRRRRDVLFTSRDAEQRATAGARCFLADKFNWSHDRQIMAELRTLLDLSDDDASAAWKIERAIETGELVTVPDQPMKGTSVHQNAGGERRGPKPREVVAALPLFRRAASVAASVRSFERPRLPRLPAEDFPAIWAAEPGDVLPDGTIATALSDARPFEYVPEDFSDDTLEIAARGVSMTGNEPGGFRVNANGLDVDYFDSAGKLCAQYHASHGEPHGHNFFEGKRDNAHLPMSSINCE